MQIDLKHNNFDALRLAAASSVVVSHCYTLYGKPMEPLTKFSGNMETLGSLAVSVFFIISGYLITHSYLRSGDALDYVKKRVLRIFPALIVCVAICALIIGPIVSTRDVAVYFSHAAPFRFLANGLMVLNQRMIPGVFDTPPNTTMLVNGPLWTLPVEFAMYLMVLALGLMRALKPARVPFIMAAALYLFLHKADTGTFYMNGAVPQYFAVKHALSFFMGMIFYLHRDRIPYTWPLFFWVTALTLVTLKTEYFRCLFIFTLPYMVLYLASIQNRFINHIARHGDFSYGMYIYGYPVQQTVMHAFGYWLSLPAYILVSLLFTAACAIFSWNCIEKPALAWKHKRLFAPTPTTQAA